MSDARTTTVYWTKMSPQCPENEPLFLYSPTFVDEDFNNSGIVEGFIDADRMLVYWQWNNCQSAYDTMRVPERIWPPGLYFSVKTRPGVIEYHAALDVVKAQIMILLPEYRAYEMLRVWHSSSGSQAYYVNEQIEKAKQTGAPIDAIYERDGVWATISSDDFQNLSMAESLLHALKTNGRKMT